MDKNTIAEKIESSFLGLQKYNNEITAEKWISGPEGKWTVGQHYLHLLKSAQMLNKALSYPKFVLRYKFGKANRPCRTYDDVAKRYIEKLNKNKERARTFNQDLKEVPVKSRKAILEDLEIEYRKLEYTVKKLSEKSLDKLILPHPLMGKMILREIIMWSAYHTDHHLEILQKNY